MAGTLVADVLQDGAGNSTSMDNAIYGSAKAWVNFGYISSAIVVNASYNVSSVTRSSTGNYVVNFNNAFVDNNYALAVALDNYGVNNPALVTSKQRGNTASAAYLNTFQTSSNAATDCTQITMAFFR